MATPQTGTPATSAGMSNRFIAVAGFVVAGSTLVLVADYSPQLAIGTASLMLLAMLVARSNEVVTLVDDWRAAVTGG